jgi:2',3'-cyclic-nucleotide 2'-phosphodiesterase (5'-nucleotidase family)
MKQEARKSSGWTARTAFGVAAVLWCGVLFAPAHAAEVLEAPVAAAVELEYIRVDADITPDAHIAGLVRPYAEDLRRVMERRITVSEAVMPVAQPESALGNLAADILRDRASESFGREVDIALMNHRGLRIPLPEGDVTVGTMFELMPFENYITLLRFTGAQLLQLADELAAYGGEPISGMRMVIDGRRARDVTVGGAPVDPDALYWLATNNWLANGGGEMPTLWEPVERVDMPVLIRESFIDYLEGKDSIAPYVDGRVREVEP